VKTTKKAVFGLLAAGLCCSACSREEPAWPPNTSIVLITIDALRADHLSSYGYPRETSPVIDQLAAEGVLFQRAAVQWPKTGPSFASMFTATYPKDNGIVRKIGIALPSDFDMLAEELRAAGFQTHAIVANGALSSEFLFDQGFDSYTELWNLPDEGEIQPTQAGFVTDRALEVTDEIDPDKPFFLWVHYLDPHFPYEPPPAWRDRFQNDEWFDNEVRIEINYEQPMSKMTGIGSWRVQDGRDDLAFYIARYDAEIAYVDEEIGQLLVGLQERGVMERTLTIVTSDHGESLGEHYYFFDHGGFGFQTCLRVPLIVHYPGVIEPAVDPDPVELMHLAPTLLEAAGAELVDGRWGNGESLAVRLGRQRRSQRAEPAEPHLAFSEAGYGRPGMWQKIVQDRRYKLVDAQEGGAQRWISGEVGRRYALFDLERDPGETENLFDPEHPEVERLARALRRWQSGNGGDPIEPDSEMDAKTRRQLEALGYL
jgi:arylsulfatase